MCMGRLSKSCGSKSNMCFRCLIRVNSCHLTCILVVRGDRFLDSGLLSSAFACRSVNLVASCFTWVNCFDCWWIAKYLRWQTVSEPPKLLPQHEWVLENKFRCCASNDHACPWIWRSYLVVFGFLASRQFGVRSLNHDISQHREVEDDT